MCVCVCVCVDFISNYYRKVTFLAIVAAAVWYQLKSVKISELQRFLYCVK